MPRHARRSAGGAVRRDAKRRKPSNDRWMHLGSSEVSARTVIQRGWAQCNRAVTRASYFGAMMLAFRQAISQTDPAIATALQPVISVLLVQIAVFSQTANNYRNLDHLLYDIPEEEYRYHRTQRPRQHLRLASFPDDRTAIKLTSFSNSELRRLYNCFGIAQHCLVNGSTHIRMHTGHYDPTNGTPKCYLYHPEELFLFTLAKIKTGKTNEQLCDNYFGGDYCR